MISKTQFLVGFKIVAIIAIVIGAGPTDATGNSYEANYKKQAEFPIVDNIGGKLILKNNWKINDDFDNLKLKVNFADRYQKENLKDIKIILDYSIGNNVITVRPSESWSMSAKLQNGNYFIWGAITGDFNDESLGNSLVTVSFFEIPEENKVTFNVLIEANDQHPPIFLSFGNLDTSPEILDIMQNEAGRE